MHANTRSAGSVLTASLFSDPKHKHTFVLLFRLFQDGLTALHLAADGGHYECVKLLLESGCNVGAQTNVGLVYYQLLKLDRLCTLKFCCGLQRNMNALHYVAQRGFDREARLLLQAGININAVDSVSKTSNNLFITAGLRIKQRRRQQTLFAWLMKGFDRCCCCLIRTFVTFTSMYKNTLNGYFTNLTRSPVTVAPPTTSQVSPFVMSQRDSRLQRGFSCSLAFEATDTQFWSFANRKIEILQIR